MNRKLLFCVLMVAVAGNIAAQDIIETTSSTIEGKVVEISQTEIKYKEQTHLDGPSYVLPLSEVKSITFENGTVKLFKKDVVESAGKQNAAAPSLSAITKLDDVYYMDGKPLSQERYEHFLMENCPDAYLSMQRGKKLCKTGWGLLIPGIVLSAVGTGLMSSGLAGLAGLATPLYGDDAYGVWQTNKMVAGCLVFAAGHALGIASIPCLVVGNIKKNNAHEVYNAQCVQQTASLNLQLQTSGNGVGLALCW